MVIGSAGLPQILQQPVVFLASFRSQVAADAGKPEERTKAMIWARFATSENRNVRQGMIRQGDETLRRH